MLYALVSWKAAFGAAARRGDASLLNHTSSEAAAFDRLMAKAPRVASPPRDA